MGTPSGTAPGWVAAWPAVGCTRSASRYSTGHAGRGRPLGGHRQGSGDPGAAIVVLPLLIDQDQHDGQGEEQY